MFKLNIVTGLSGAGKTFANKCLEDMGYYCVDNLPPELIPDIAELCTNSKRKINKVSLVIDIRGGEFFDDLFLALDALDQADYEYSILFLDASDETLIRRYKETRRRHPLAVDNDSLIDGIRAERKHLKQIKDRADLYIDTSKMNPWALKTEISRMIASDENSRRISVSIISFGFKHGLPLDSDHVFDVRFLPNPYYDEELKELTGETVEIHDFVMKSHVSKEYFNKIADFSLFVLPHTVAEGKSNMVIAIGCTGGRHRSVVLAIELGRVLSENGYKVTVRHRDISGGH